MLKFEWRIPVLQVVFENTGMFVPDNELLSKELLLYLCPLAGLLFLTIFLICLYIALNRHKKLLELQNKQYEQLIEYTGIIEDLYEDIRNQKHDFMNILFSIKGYVEGEQWEEFNSLYRSFLKENDESAPKNFLLPLKRIHDPGVKCILGHKLNQAVTMGIMVQLYVFTPMEFQQTDPLALCRLIGILTDNAIEAAAESREKELHIVMDCDETFTSVIISNTYDVKPDITNLYKRGYSTKGAHRGVGLYNVKQILSHYPSIALKTTVENNMFFQELNISQ